MKLRLLKKIDGLTLLGTMEGDVSFVLTFDEKYPSNGWRASIQRVGRPIQHIPTGFKSKRAAIRALEAEQRRIAQ